MPGLTFLALTVNGARIRPARHARSLRYGLLNLMDDEVPTAALNGGYPRAVALPPRTPGRREIVSGAAAKSRRHGLAGQWR